MDKPASNVTLIIEGRHKAAETPVPPPELAAIIGPPRLAQSYELEPTLRGEAPPEVRVDARGNDLIELRLEGDLRLLMSVDDYRAQFGDKTSRGGEEAGAVRIRATLPATSRERGILQWVVKGLQLIGIDLTQMAAHKLADYVDTKKGLEGLYTCPLSSNRLDLTPRPLFAPGSEPLLVFIHGTMSSTEGSFGGLWSDRKDVRLRLAQRYNERCYAFEHKTFTESPISNALALANALPEGARLHLVSHSRGGMIGELLCRASRINEKGEPLLPFDDTDFGLFARQQVTRSDLRELAEVLGRNKLVVERFVRVACPARGTTLASGRLDRYLSVLRMGLSPLTDLDWVKDVAWFVAAVIKEKTDPAVMPGLEAMMPDSATVKMLNRQDLLVDSDLRVIAGDYDGDGMLGTVADWAFEGFFGSENDVVVNTPSMYGGALRRDRNRQACGWYYYAQGSQVYHFSYFKQPATAGQLANGLLQADAQSAGFLPVSQAPHAADAIARGIVVDYLKEELGAPLERKDPSPNGAKPLLVLVPGIMGSHLRVGEERIWISASEIAVGEFTRLQENAAGVATDGVVRMSYQALGAFLSASHEVLYYPYDWRISLQKKGREFADYMDRVLTAAATNNRAVRILAHSMGGLLVRMAAVLSSPAKQGGNGWWERFRSASGSRFVMAGTPNGGSWSVPYVLTGRDDIITMLSAVDLRHNKKEILKVVSGFEGFLDMLPPDGRDNCFDAATWTRWLAADGNSWPPPDQTTLDSCLENRQLLDQFDFQQEKGVVRYVAGCADSTPFGVEIQDGEIVFGSSRQGDGRVLWKSGIPAGIKTWFVDAKHGDLLKYEPAFNGLYDIITRGDTSNLAPADPRLRGEEAGPGRMVERPIPFLPDEAMLQRAALGGEILPPRKRLAEGRARCFRVTVCHGDLMAAKFPVAVGHYIGDSINGTEGALDRRLSGLLSQRHKLGIYPGHEGTADVFVHEEGGQATCAIVVGLGQVGDLTPAALATGFATALLKFATSPVANRATVGEGGGFAISSIIIGSGAGWGLSVRDSIRSLVEGGCRANALLAELEGPPIYLAELQLLEVFEDRALQALRAVRTLASQGTLGSIKYGNELMEGGGGRYRAMIDDTGDWWRRIKVQVNEDDEMTYTTLTGLARIEETVRPTQRALVDRLVEQAVTQTSVSEEAMVAIYNLLTPSAMNGHSEDQGDTLLMLDPKAAHYPWEMMHVAGRDRKVAVALQWGLIRQLSVQEFRLRPARAYQLRALVVANPQLSKNNSFPDLPGAEQEGRSVTQVLEASHYTVTPQIGSEPLAIVTSLFADNYRILHLAGHGIYRYAMERTRADGTRKTVPVTGMVLDWPGEKETREPVFLTAVEVERMPVVPELVFINCCYLGNIDISREDRSRFAASLAAEFIAMGVRAVVAAGWAVNDAAAAAFAEKFYDSLLHDASFGDAVTAARKAAKDAAPAHNTWAAYQCYGDPSYRLTGDRAESAAKFFLAPREAICELQAIHALSKGGASDAATLTRRLQEVESGIPHEWMTRSGALRAALARVYADVSDFQRAVEEYEAAARCPDGGCTVKDLDQLANLKAHLAEKLVKDGGLAEEEGREQVTRVIAQLEARSADLGETPDRSEITGSAYKHLLMIGSYHKKKTGELLEKIAEWYEKAAATPEPDPGPILNAICSRILAQSRKAHIDPAEVTLLREELNQATAAGAALFRREAKFRNGVHEIDAELYLMLLNSVAGGAAVTATAIEQLYQRYRKLRDERGTARELDSVAQRVRFVRDFLPESAAELKKKLDQLVESLEKG